MLGGQGGAADLIVTGTHGQGLVGAGGAGGVSHDDAVHNSHGTIGEGGVIVEGQRGRGIGIFALGHQSTTVHVEGVRKGAGLRQHDGIALEGGSAVGIPLGGLDDHVALDGIKAGGGGQLVGLQGQGIRINAHVAVRQGQGLVGDHGTLAGELVTDGDVTTVGVILAGSRQRTVGQFGVGDLRALGVHSAVGDVEVNVFICV